MISEIFLIKTKVNTSKNSFKMERWVNRICDECGEKQKARYNVIIRGRKRRSKDIDLCKLCSNLTKYRSSIFNKKMDQAINWKGGENIDKGYIKIYVGNGKRIFKHVQIYEDYIKRKLNKTECIHHIDLDKTNNNISNLFLCENKKFHTMCHQSLQKAAISLFLSFIWFDRQNKTYTTNPINSIFCKIKKIDFPEHCKFGMWTPTKKNRRGKRKIGYRVFWAKDETGKRISRRVHSYIAENIIGRKLYASECVHHIDYDTLNNNIDNLIVLTRREHALAHFSLEKCAGKLYKQGTIKFNSGEYYCE